VLLKKHGIEFHPKYALDETKFIPSLWA